MEVTIEKHQAVAKNTKRKGENATAIDQIGVFFMIMQLSKQ